MSNLVPIDEPTSFENSLLPTALECWLVSSDMSLIQATSNLLATCVNLNQKCVPQSHLEKELNKPNVAAPDVLLLDDLDSWESTLEFFNETYGDSSLTSLLLTREADTDLMRQALRRGVKDVLTIPANPDDLYNTLYDTAQAKLASS